MELKRFLLLLSLAVLFGAFPAYAENVDCSVAALGSIKIKNSSGGDISAIYVAQSNSDVPESTKNQLKQGTLLKNGATASFSLEGESSPQLWTIKAVEVKGRTTIYEKLPLLLIYDLELLPGGKTKYKEIRYT